MRLIEIFSSVQGEGVHLGVPCNFIRTAGCNLSCYFCDTKESWCAECCLDFSIPNIIHTLDKTYPYVVITGGEPGIQPELEDLIDALHVAGFTVGIESNGTQNIPLSVDWLTVSPKADSKYVINSLRKPDELKYVVTDDFDADAIITEELRQLYAGRIWLQPNGDDMQNMWKKAMTIAMSDSRLRVGVQLHKLMEVK